MIPLLKISSRIRVRILSANIGNWANLMYMSIVDVLVRRGSSIGYNYPSNQLNLIYESEKRLYYAINILKDYQ